MHKYRTDIVQTYQTYIKASEQLISITDDIITDATALAPIVINTEMIITI